MTGELLWLEWRRFHDETNVNRTAWVAREVKRHDPNHPVTTNVMVSSQFGPSASKAAHDVYGLSKALDVFGMDLYTDVRRDYRPTDAMVYSISDRLGGSLGYHCLETQPTNVAVAEGGWGTQDKGYRKFGDDRRLIPWGWRPLAFGARSLLYWVWRLQQPNVWAIARPDGSLSEFAEQTKRLSDEFGRVWPKVAGSELLPSEVAIVHNRASIHLAALQDMPEVVGESVQGAFAACWEQRVLPDVLDEEQVLAGALRANGQHRYKVVIAPFLFVTSARLSAALREFVEGGGHLFWDARSGSYGEDAGGFREYFGASKWKLCYFKVPANSFQEVMGYRTLGVFGVDQPHGALESGLGDLPAGTRFVGLNWWDDLEPAPGAEVLARLDNGRPALVASRHGLGRTYACAVDLCRAHHQGATRGDHQSLARVGGRPRLLVDGRPFLILGLQWDCDGCFSAEEMNPLFAHAARLGANAVTLPTYWHEIEPEPGRYDFRMVDERLRVARENGLRIIPLWFATWKNACSFYAPDYVKADPETYRLAVDRQGRALVSLCPTCESTWQRDRAALCALMAHLRDVDAARTVIMVQIENEPGILKSDRCYCPGCEERFAAGRWQETWGPHAAEAFSAASVATYIDRLSVEAKAIYPLPTYANVWLAPAVGGIPGEYPAGGGVAEMLSVFREHAPHLDLVAPDIYSSGYRDFQRLCRAYSASGNPLYVAEHSSSITGRAERNVFYALGEYGAVGFDPWAIDYPFPQRFGHPLVDPIGGEWGPQAYTLRDSYVALSRAIQPIVEA